MIGIQITACEKIEPCQFEYSIVGEWNWLESRGGFTGSTLYNPENTGLVKILSFTNNDTAILTANEDTVFNTDYVLGYENSEDLGEGYQYVVMNSIRYRIQELSEILWLDDDFCDGFSHIYERIRH